MLAQGFFASRSLVIDIALGAGIALLLILARLILGNRMQRNLVFILF